MVGVCRALQLIACGLVLIAGANAQTQVWPDSRGTDFWFTFLPNYHNDESEIDQSPGRRKQHELYVYISAERPTSGTITWTDDTGRENMQMFVINDVRQVYSMSVYYRGVELRGINQNGEPLRFFGTDNESVTPKSFHVVANDDVTVYALNQAVLTSDAFLVLPTDAIAEDYVVLGYNSDVRRDNGGAPTDQTTPSQFAIVGTVDGTTVDITPSVPTPGNPNKITQRITLDQGQVYLVQADIRVGNDPDLTGSLVRASRPVAVFTGHNRTVLPIASRGALNSRDCLVEQLNPVRTWGKSAYVTPFARSTNELNDGDNLFRVLAAFDNTEVYVDGVLRSTLSAGQHYEEPLRIASEIRASKPISVAQYKKSSGVASQNSVTRYGDPFMMLVPPAEQFMNNYRFVSVQSYNYSETLTVTDSVYTQQWLNVVIPTSAIARLTIDGRNADELLFSRIGSTGYSWAQISMTDGVHEMLCDTTFGIYVYGYGLANSYGYIGGMSFRPLDVVPPELTGDYQCFEFTGVVTDSLLIDSRVATLSVKPGSEVNARFTAPTFVPPQAVVPFNVALVDAYLDGSVVLMSSDYAGNEMKEQLVAIPGFTVAVRDQRNDPNVRERSFIVPVGRTKCDSFELENYGLFNKQITQMYFRQGTTITSPVAPFTIMPGERVFVRYCYTGTVEQDAVDTLVIGDTCTERTILAAVFQERIDRDGPSLEESSDACSTNVVVVVADEGGANLGMVSCAVIDSVTLNCTVTLEDSTLNARQYRVLVLDPYRDAIYGFDALDSAGNRTFMIDTVPGFMLSVRGDLNPTTTYSFGDRPIGEIWCDTLQLQNQGVASVALADAYVYENTIFSVPRAQFTVSISPSGGTNALVVCFSPREVREGEVFVDTVELKQGCLVRKIALDGVAVPLTYSGISRCEVPVDANSTLSVGSITFYPQPASDDVTIVFPSEVSDFTVQFSTAAGSVVSEEAWKGGSTKAVRVDCSSMQRGVYACTIRTPDAVFHGVCVVR